MLPKGSRFGGVRLLQSWESCVVISLHYIIIIHDTHSFVFQVTIPPVLDVIFF